MKQKKVVASQMFCPSLATLLQEETLSYVSEALKIPKQCL
jgi:hypothetical protein